MKRIILASASPRRREILKLAVPDFDVIKSGACEKDPGLPPHELVMYLSEIKAMDVIKSHSEKNKLIIGADTLVSINNEILGKPSGVSDAFEMIKKLEGSVHHVYTGVTIMEAIPEENDIRKFSFYEKTDVNVISMSDDEIKGYVNSDEPYDKAGGYGIQGSFAAFISGINGDYYNVMGLPLCRLLRELKDRFGFL